MYHNKISPQKRVAFVSHTTEFTGAAMSYYTLLTGLDSSEFEFFPVLPDRGPMYDRLLEDGLRPSVVAFSGLSKLTAVGKCKQYFKEKNIELVYLSCAHKFSRMAGKAAHALNIPVVWHVREPPKGNRVQKNIPYMRKFSAKVVVVSHEQAQVISPAIKVIKVDNGVDTRRFDASIEGTTVRQRYGLQQSDCVFGIVGTIEKRKNTENFLLAAEHVVDKYKNAKFLVVGSGKEAYVAHMHELLEKKPALKAAVTFTGNVWNVPEVLAGLDVLVMPSNWEAFPRVVIEGMTMGKVVVASDVGDVGYIIDHGRNGFVVPPQDLDALSQTMLHCARLEKSERADISDSAHKKAVEHFSQEVHVAKMRTIFQSALAP